MGNRVFVVRYFKVLLQWTLLNAARIPTAFRNPTRKQGILLSVPRFGF